MAIAALQILFSSIPVKYLGSDSSMLSFIGWLLSLQPVIVLLPVLYMTESGYSSHPILPLKNKGGQGRLLSKNVMAVVDFAHLLGITYSNSLSSIIPYQLETPYHMLSHEF